MKSPNYIHFFTKLSLFIIIGFSFFLFLKFQGIYATNLCSEPGCSTGWRVAVGETETINCCGVCRRVTNNCAKAIFVPTRTSSEWAEFRDHKPGCVSLSKCIFCSGTVNLTLSPSTVSPSESFTATVSGLSGCDGKSARFYKGGTYLTSCTVSGSGCSVSLTAPSSTGSYTYKAGVDKNGDGDINDSGEWDTETLTVSGGTVTDRDCPDDCDNLWDLCNCPTDSPPPICSPDVCEYSRIGSARIGELWVSPFSGGWFCCTKAVCKAGTNCYRCDYDGNGHLRCVRTTADGSILCWNATTGKLEDCGVCLEQHD